MHVNKIANFEEKLYLSELNHAELFGIREKREKE